MGPYEIITVRRALSTWEFSIPLAVQGYAQLKYTFNVHNILIISIANAGSQTILGRETYNQRGLNN